MPLQPYQPKRILLTGAKGFVGTYLHAAVRERWPHAEISPLATQAEATPDFVAADLLDRTALDAAVADSRPDVVIHLAGQASVARGVKDAGETWAVNVSGALNLATAVAHFAPEATLLFASSSEVYGASFLGGTRVTEATPLLPLNAYARSKALAEQVLSDVLPEGSRLIVVRPFNHTGPGQREDFVLPSFAAQVARIESGRQPPRLDVGNLDVARDFLDVRDVVDAYLALIECAPRLPPRFTCNVASDAVRPLREHVDTLQALSRRPFDIVVDPTRLRPVDLPLAAGDAKLLRALTGWRPRHDLRITLQSMLEAARVTEKAANSDSHLDPDA